nr:GNAT family N-acetyltransferase [Pseudomonadales bacterium]
WIAREHWGFGYATEVAAGLIKYAETTLGCRRIEASYQKDNVASARVLGKLDFLQCGGKVVFSLARGLHVRSTCVSLDLRH